MCPTIESETTNVRFWEGAETGHSELATQGSYSRQVRQLTYKLRDASMMEPPKTSTHRHSFARTLWTLSLAII